MPYGTVTPDDRPACAAARVAAIVLAQNLSESADDRILPAESVAGIGPSDRGPHSALMMAASEEETGTTSMKHCSLADMPLAVTKQIVDSAGYEWWPILVRVSKPFRDAIRDLHAGGERSKGWRG